MSEKIYPIGIQNFEKLRKGGYSYVDKTFFRQSYHLRNAFCKRFPSFFSKIRPADKHTSLCRRIKHFSYLCTIL